MANRQVRFVRWLAFGLVLANLAVLMLALRSARSTQTDAKDESTAAQVTPPAGIAEKAIDPRASTNLTKGLER
jgi:hypothetical protein